MTGGAVDPAGDPEPIDPEPIDPELRLLRLEHGPDGRGVVDELAGGLQRVGLDGVLADLDRHARPMEVPARAAVEGFAFDRADEADTRWYPQGVSWADSAATGGVDGRSILVTSWYARDRRWRGSQGARLTFVDYTDPQNPRYRHVLLVEAVPDRRGRPGLRPVLVHAGGICWHGDLVYVAGTEEGIRVFRLSDLLAVPDERNRAHRVGRGRQGSWSAFGYRYVLPQAFAYTAWSADDREELRYSFLSFDGTGDPAGLVVGEYGRGAMTTRLTRFGLDRGSHLLTTDESGHAWPVELHPDQLEQMQGAAVIHGRYAITCSRGRARPGDLWTGRPGSWAYHRAVLAVGPEDITYWPHRRQLWTVSEWPRRRWVYALDADTWITDLP